MKRNQKIKIELTYNQALEIHTQLVMAKQQNDKFLRHDDWKLDMPRESVRACEAMDRAWIRTYKMFWAKIMKACK